jgi:hypothetical protein
MADTIEAIKIKFYDLLVELNEIISKKWQLLTNNGLKSLNEISNLFTKHFTNEIKDDDETPKTTPFNDIQAINVEFENLIKILDSFKVCIEKMNHIEIRLLNILDYEFIKRDNLIDKVFISNIVSSFSKEFKLKESLIKEYLFKMRQNRQELVTITCYWIHEPNLDQILYSQLKFLVNYFKNNV